VGIMAEMSENSKNTEFTFMNKKNMGKSPLVANFNIQKYIRNGNAWKGAWLKTTKGLVKTLKCEENINFSIVGWKSGNIWSFPNLSLARIEDCLESLLEDKNFDKIKEDEWCENEFSHSLK